MPYIKNLPPEQVVSLAGQVSAQPGQIVSRTLAQNEAVSLTLFAFSQGEEISTHDSRGDAMVLVLEGTGQFTVGGTVYQMCIRDSISSIPTFSASNTMFGISFSGL